MTLIGLTGGPGAGKDTVAHILGTYGYEQHAFADSLRSFLYATDTGWRLAFDMHGYEQAKLHVEGFRQRMIDVGEGARAWIGPDVWVDSLAAKIADPLLDHKLVVVSDVRYLNEAELINDFGGWVIGVEREGHLSETDEARRVFANADDWIINNGTEHDLYARVHELVTRDDD